MGRKVILHKATRIEGNANIQIEIEGGHIKTARFLVHDFRGFERFVKGRRVEFVPHLVSRICGLCSAAHQVAAFRAIENALNVRVPLSVDILREIIVLGEWISSHALSFFFLSMPDFVGTDGGIFQMMKSHPEISEEAFTIRKAGQRIIELLGRRSVHPVSMGIGQFLIQPDDNAIEEVRQQANTVKERTRALIHEAAKPAAGRKGIAFPPDQQINFLVYEDHSGGDMFRVYDRYGQNTLEFLPEEFDKHIAEMRADWTYAKFPYLRKFGFPAGIMLVGPLSRSFRRNGILGDHEMSEFGIMEQLIGNDFLNLESYDICRLLEIFWASRRILNLLEVLNLSESSSSRANFNSAGHGIGVVEAPRGVLVHSYHISNGCIENLRLLVATQFNNTFINLLLREIAEKHHDGATITREGEHLLGRCVRTFDPCISCASH